MTKARALPEAMLEFWSCDPATGIIRWKKAPRNIGRYRRNVGDQVGVFLHGPVGNRYAYVHFDGRPWLLHRTVWFLCTGDQPAGLLDHIDRDTTNNRMANLRPATPSQNQANRIGVVRRGLPKRVSKTPDGKFVAHIMKDRRQRYLGTYSTVGAAERAYIEAARDLFGEFARSA